MDDEEARWNVFNETHDRGGYPLPIGFVRAIRKLGKMILLFAQTKSWNEGHTRGVGIMDAFERIPWAPATRARARYEGMRDLLNAAHRLAKWAVRKRYATDSNLDNAAIAISNLSEPSSACGSFCVHPDAI